jgi:hypothetical protein
VLDTYNRSSNSRSGSRSATILLDLTSPKLYCLNFFVGENKEKQTETKTLTRLLLGGLQTIPRTPHSRVPVVFLPRRAGHVEGRGGVGDDAYVLDYVLGEMDGMEGLNRENGEDGVDVDVG